MSTGLLDPDSDLSAIGVQQHHNHHRSSHPILNARSHSSSHPSAAPWYDHNGAPPPFHHGDYKSILGVNDYQSSVIKTIYMPDKSCMQVRPAVGPGGVDLNSSTATNARTTPATNQQVNAALLSLAVIAIPSLIVAILTIQILINLQYYASHLSSLNPDSQPPAYYYLIHDIACSLCAVVLALTISSAFTAILQLFVSLKTLKMYSGAYSSVLSYLSQGMFLRFFTFTGFFASIPIFLIATVLSMHIFGGMFGSLVSAYVFTITAGVGVVLCLATILHTVYSWLWGTLSISNMRHYVDSFASSNHNQSGSKLSTLV